MVSCLSFRVNPTDALSTWTDNGSNCSALISSIPCRYFHLNGYIDSDDDGYFPNVDGIALFGDTLYRVVGDAAFPIEGIPKLSAMFDGEVGVSLDGMVYQYDMDDMPDDEFGEYSGNPRKIGYFYGPECFIFDGNQFQVDFYNTVGDE